MMTELRKENNPEAEKDMRGNHPAASDGQTSAHSMETKKDTSKEEAEKITSEDSNSTKSQQKTNRADVIDLRVVFRNILHHKKTFAIVLPIVFLISCLHILNVPRYYTTSISLAPEVENPTATGGLSSIASSFGIDLSQMQSTDAITPLLYPDLMDDNKFVTDLFNIDVSTCDDALHCTYYEYLTKYQEKAWYEKPLKWMKKHLFSSSKPTGKVVKSANGTNPYILPKATNDIVNSIRNNIKITVDKKTGVITLSATAQDPLICKTIADSVTLHLQEFITTYRTSKAQKDVIYYKHLRDEAKKAYETVRKKYAVVSDANQDVLLQTVKSELEDLENDMQLKYNQFTTYDTQYQAAIARLRENTPVFTTLKGANVPVLPAGPKRMLFVLGMTILAFIVVSLYYAKDEISHSINH
ncbi:MAG: chain-length determining protein [Prevotella sp.]|jgi:uncharacterized protein involved in exopolysaccharide biosynthesis